MLLRLGIARQKWGDEFKRFKGQNENQQFDCGGKLCLNSSARSGSLTNALDSYSKHVDPVDQTHKRALVIFSVDKCANKVKVLIISTLDVNIEIEKSSFDVLSHDLFIGKIITHSI